MNNLAVLKTLSYLYRIVEAGELGYAVSASNVNNQGLKILFRSHAQQRARFKSEIMAEIQRLGIQHKPRNSIRGVLHRGRINIFSALAAGKDEKEKIILNEIMEGEKIAARTYEAVLKKELSSELRELILHQYAEVTKVIEQIQHIRGKNGVRLLVQLFNTEGQASTAIRELRSAGFQLDSIQLILIHNSTELYTSRNTTVRETSISGSVGGALWGCLIGALAGFGAERTAALGPLTVSSGAGILIAVAGLLAGAFIGGGLGFAIGTGISGEDNYQYDKSLKQSEILLLTLVKVLHVSEIGLIMERINSKVTSEELTA